MIGIGGARKTSSRVTSAAPRWPIVNATTVAFPRSDQLLCGNFPRVSVRRFASGQLAHLPQVRLDEIDAFGRRRRERRSRRVQHEPGAALFCDSRHLRIEVVRNAIGQAAACDQEARKRLECRNQLQAFLPLGLVEPRTGKNEAVLLARTDFVDEEIFSRFARNRPGVAGNALLIEQLPQQLSDRSAYRVDRTGIAAEPPDDPRDIDAAPAGIAPLRFAAQLGHRHDPVDRRREIDRRVRSDRDDIGHGLISNRGRSALWASVGDPGMTRTCDLRFRKPSLYPAELRDRGPAA